jgi:hypothetical protein
LEALASGLPVVGLYAEGTVDLVTHLRNGLLLDVHSVGDFNAPWNASVPAAPKTTVACYDSCADLMHPSSPSFGVIAARYALLLERLISDPALRGDMAAAALSCAQEYSWDRCMRRILDAYLDASPHRLMVIKMPAVDLDSKWGFLRFAADVLGVAFAIFVAVLSHMLYMIPTLADLFG